VKIFEKLSRKVSGTNCHLPTISKIANNKLFLLTIKRTLKNFHEIFGLRPNRGIAVPSRALLHITRYTGGG